MEEPRLYRHRKTGKIIARKQLLARRWGARATVLAGACALSALGAWLSGDSRWGLIALAVLGIILLGSLGDDDWSGGYMG